MRANEFINEGALGVNPKRMQREGSRDPRGHAPVKQFSVDEDMGESTNWALHNDRVGKRRVASPEELYAEFKKYANNPGHHYYKGKFSDDSDTGGKSAEQKAIGNIALGIGKADKKNYRQMIDHLLTQDAQYEDCEIDEAGKAPRKLCISKKSDDELGASQLSSCKAQGLRKRDTKRKFRIGKNDPKKIKGKLVKSSDYGGPLPKWKGN
jgi:hypothetical protein